MLKKNTVSRTGAVASKERAQCAKWGCHEGAGGRELPKGTMLSVPA